jgi:glycosyltransferase involved in cell wall biosynthesis
MDVLIKLAKQAEKYPDILILIIGTGPKFNELKEKTKNIKNIKLLGYLKQENLYKVLVSSDILLISLKNDINYTKNIPSKLYDYLASKKPIVINIPGSCQEIIKEHNCGLYNTEFNDQQFIDNVIKLYKDKELRDKLENNINKTLTKIEIKNIIQK